MFYFIADFALHAEADSPGHTAKYQLYTRIDYCSEYNVGLLVLDKCETNLGLIMMELYICLWCLYQVVDSRVSVNKVCKDQHTIVCKFFCKWFVSTRDKGTEIWHLI